MSSFCLPDVKVGKGWIPNPLTISFPLADCIICCVLNNKLTSLHLSQARSLLGSLRLACERTIAAQATRSWARSSLLSMSSPSAFPFFSMSSLFFPQIFLFLFLRRSFSNLSIHHLRVNIPLLSQPSMTQLIYPTYKLDLP